MVRFEKFVLGRGSSSPKRTGRVVHLGYTSSEPISQRLIGLGSLQKPCSERLTTVGQRLRLEPRQPVRSGGYFDRKRPPQSSAHDLMLEHSNRHECDAHPLHRGLYHGHGTVEDRTMKGWTGDARHREPQRPFVCAIGSQQDLSAQIGRAAEPGGDRVEANRR